MRIPLFLGVRKKTPTTPLFFQCLKIEKEERRKRIGCCFRFIFIFLYFEFFVLIIFLSERNDDYFDYFGRR